MTSEEEQKRLGSVVAGSLTQGVEVRLDEAISVEDMVVGRYVAIEGAMGMDKGTLTVDSMEEKDHPVILMP